MTKIVSFKLNEGQKEMLDTLCRKHRRTQSDMIRILIEDAHKRDAESDTASPQ